MVRLYLHDVCKVVENFTNAHNLPNVIVRCVPVPHYNFSLRCYIIHCVAPYINEIF